LSKSTITIDISLDEQKVPESITWRADNSSVEKEQKARAMMLSFWDGAEKTAMRIDLWTKEMMVDEMADFFFQSMMTMADTYGRATQYHEQVTEMKSFAQAFLAKFKAQQSKSQQG
jgi:gliding motility-associated protein GldC